MDFRYVSDDVIPKIADSYGERRDSLSVLYRRYKCVNRISRLVCISQVMINNQRFQINKTRKQPSDEQQVQILAKTVIISDTATNTVPEVITERSRSGVESRVWLFYTEPERS